MRVANRQHAIARMRADLPPIDGMAPIQPVAFDRVFILHDIAGFHPGEPFSRREFVSHEKGGEAPGHIAYSLNYKPSPNDPSACQTCGVSVSVDQYPSSRWAVHFADYPPRIANSFDNPKHHALTIKFQNRVRTNAFERINSTAVPLYYMWSSGDNVITISYNRKEEIDDFVRAYLEKYPSSVRSAP